MPIARGGTAIARGGFMNGPDASRIRGGATVWLTGLPSAGKTTLALGLRDLITATGQRVEVLDGDELRAGLCRDLGFTREDRHANVTRIGFVAQLLAKHGLTVLVPVIAPYASSRAEVKAHHRRMGTAFFEIYVATSVDECRARDVKGLYAKQSGGLLRGLTGVDDPYEVPEDPDLLVQTEDRSISECVHELHKFLVDG